jgi:thioredoxin 1
MAAEITDGNFKTEVLDSSKVTVLHMWAEWCAPCKVMDPTLQSLEREYEGRAVIAKMNVDDYFETPQKYGVKGLPTFLIFNNGVEADRIVGLTSKESLANAINRLLV